jgi:two-component system sensor kinase
VKTTLDMTALARSVAEELKASVVDGNGHAGRKIIFRFHPLPPAPGEETMIHQVFFNLIGNALKFTRPRETAVIEVGGGVNGTENVYYVRDNGVGFDMAGSERLFRLFSRLHTEREFEGTGAGLAIVGRIIERHGGRVWAEGRAGAGAVFYFSLPSGRGLPPEALP